MRNSSLRNSSAKSSTNQIPTENNSSQVGNLDMRNYDGETHYEPFLLAAAEEIYVGSDRAL